MNIFSNLNHLPVDVKMLIANGQTLVNEVRDRMKDQNYQFDLTSKMQLKNDCKEVERNIKLISKGKINDKNRKALELSIVRLKTNLDGITNFFSR